MTRLRAAAEVRASRRRCQASSSVGHGAPPVHMQLSAPRLRNLDTASADCRRSGTLAHPELTII
ncbi:hypothetical protein QMK17_09770 [Rhodococcus sp. G-MC3]|uniref:hypothetical protein n=1 Tax=Rhodococcus sp. G-MC3 TaxID=3046209 RepID=UPI0024B99202|nr:hypothetical protein [Rhodococcus sp. G-MC3]MDJ0393616.1 hypothetical protein [Rhodococcus sp. G-MC3]